MKKMCRNYHDVTEMTSQLIFESSISS